MATGSRRKTAESWPGVTTGSLRAVSVLRCLRAPAAGSSSSHQQHADRGMRMLGHCSVRGAQGLGLATMVRVRTGGGFRTTDQGTRASDGPWF
jgi:hypothetical protein